MRPTVPTKTAPPKPLGQCEPTPFVLPPNPANNLHDLKKPGNIDIEELRCIHLPETDFNLTISVIFGRNAMKKATVANEEIHAGR